MDQRADQKSTRAGATTRIRTNGSNPAHGHAKRKGATNQCAEDFALPLMLYVDTQGQNQPFALRSIRPILALMFAVFHCLATRHPDDRFHSAIRTPHFFFSTPKVFLPD